MYTGTWHGGRLTPPQQNRLTGRWQILLGGQEMFSFEAHEELKARAFYSACLR